jgi:hypothetical protein
LLVDDTSAHRHTVDWPRWCDGVQSDTSLFN